MTVLLGADHAGFALKERLKTVLERRGYPVKDVSPKLVAGDDYPVAAKRVAKLVAQSAKKKLPSFGVLVCGSGLGMDIAANRTKGVRAVVVRDAKEAKLSREHNQANVLVLGSWMTKPAMAERLLDTWLKTKPSDAARHLRRIKQLDQ
jgi:RpiB/LacA/LacB family sugar-phosphate isomerase